ncbi:hypothetical protein ACIP93_35090 [Streptomyces sp. NPDC088745]|uniref:type I-G CRISPR-associated protein, Cas3-extension family n=1 Tax=Streptomyces sp. NPDC088745 TaxID=3365884 RepID=UPI003826AF8D
MHELELPALLSDSPLGFLAALGLLELTTPHLIAPPRLSWRGPAAPAVLHTHEHLTYQDLAGLLHQQLPDQPDEEPLPLAPGILSLDREPGAPNDALRMPIGLALQRLRERARRERTDNDPGARWFTGLVNQLRIAPKDPTKPRKREAPSEAWYTTTTPLFAPAGRMTLANNWTKAAEHCRKDPTQLRTALTGWQRVDGYAGANLDHYSTGNAHTHSHGAPSQQGVPGATWLALHAFPALRLTGTTLHAHTTSWTHTPNGPALTWPVWHPPLTPTAITTLLEHPHVRTHKPNPTNLTNLGITALYTAPRTRLSNSYGPLKPGQPVHP